MSEPRPILDYEEYIRNVSNSFEICETDILCDNCKQGILIVPDKKTKKIIENLIKNFGKMNPILKWYYNKTKKITVIKIKPKDIILVKLLCSRCDRFIPVVIRNKMGGFFRYDWTEVVNKNGKDIKRVVE